MRLPKRTGIAGTSIAALALLLSSCSGTAEPQGEADEPASDSATTDNDELTIGFSYMTLNNIYYDPMNEAARKAAEELGVNYVEVDARLETNRQIDGVENLIAQQVDGIILNPVDSDAVGPAILAANDAGIPLMTADVGARDGEIIAHVGSDNTEAGRVAGEYVAEQLGEGGKVAIVDGTPITTFEQRAAGFREVVEAEGLEVVTHPHATENTPEAFNEVTENLILANPEVTYLFAVNDYGAVAATQAIEAAGRDDIFVVGVDGDPDAVDLIQKGGALKATVGQQPALMGKMAMELMTAYLRGEDIDEDVPVELSLVTEDNAADFSW